MKTAIKALVLATSLVSVSALAETITINGLAANWTNVTGGVKVAKYDTSGDGAKETLLWGTPYYDQNNPVGGAPSSYSLLKTAGIQSTNVGNEFSLGKFIHFLLARNPITGARLDISMNLNIDGTDINTGSFGVNFTHQQTANCSANGCTATVMPSFETSGGFVHNGKKYNLEITGFKAGGSSLQVLIEKGSKLRSNSDLLMGKFVATDIANVSEPATLALFGLGLAGLGISRRRNK